MIEIRHHDKIVASFHQDQQRYIVDYQDLALTNSIALSLPNTQKYYTYDHRFPPYLETFLPEGYLYEVLKELLTKEFGYIDDYLMFAKLAPNIEGRIRFRSDYERLDYDFWDLDRVMHEDTPDTFHRLLDMFLSKNAISGVQPKTVALLRDKESLRLGEYIIKTWGDEYPHLAENEYFCLQACKRAGIPIPDIHLSDNRRFLIVKNFVFGSEKIWGFEEVLSLMDKNRTQKYRGSYEQVAKEIYRFTTRKKQDLATYFKMVVMNYLLKNGDAHLKNFGLLFADDFDRIALSPAYDVVTTACYLYRDKPALTLNGQKVWHGRDALIDFGIKHCLLTPQEAELGYEACTNALKETIDAIDHYIAKNPDFATVGRRMMALFDLSLTHQTHKEIPRELTRTW